MYLLVIFSAFPAASDIRREERYKQYQEYGRFVTGALPVK